MSGTDRLAVLRGQLDLTWRLAEIVFEDVTDDECLWLPSPRSWTVRRDHEGRWVPDWEAEPADVDMGARTGFPFHDGRPFVEVVAWANVELTKNVAEMGVLRRLARDLAPT